ncbi:YqiA/YcfP family alpha/beta fold hydrolase [uncultured Thiodictyon sp.]|uniref:YqiA/YcfP family alpha/beta fold hydrolase n=1 Tax=uncultured Thiodictyon sp. TaxID=1846217 RepID=UPI0025F67DAA|nr:YqiA/YcfP family alpha/beta fold hydrolase [uncultured Thiodictyon sp.]
MLVYLHGLNSSGRAAKADTLRARLSPYPVLAPDYPAHQPRAAVERLTAFFADLGSACPAVIGSSMGGFYGQWLARRFAFSHLFLINPALTPWDLFPSRLGEIMTTALGETYQVTAELGEATRAYGIADPCDGVPTTLFLDRGDEVIDYRIAESLYRDCGRLLIWDGGDHGFQHMEEAIDCIRPHLSGPHPA